MPSRSILPNACSRVGRMRSTPTTFSVLPTECRLDSGFFKEARIDGQRGESRGRPVRPIGGACARDRTSEETSRRRASVAGEGETDQQAQVSPVASVRPEDGIPSLPSRNSRICQGWKTALISPMLPLRLRIRGFSVRSSTSAAVGILVGQLDANDHHRNAEKRRGFTYPI